MTVVETSGKLSNESDLEVGCVTYMSGVYKIPKVRMSERTDEFVNVRV